MIRAELGEFNYEKQPTSEIEIEKLENKPETLLENNAKYIGQWIKNSKTRQGKATQVWPDGSMYEGWFKDNEANGKGRLIHANGDIYEGDWVDAKAHG